MSIASAFASLRMYRHFDRPYVALLTRLGIVRVACCSYGVHANGRRYSLLGRPASGDHRIMSEVLIKDSYGPILQYLPRTALRAVDVGGHIGSFMLWLGTQREIAEAHCFEPDPDSFNLCRFNLATQAHTHVVRAAIGSVSRSGTLLIDPAARARSTILPGMARAANVESVETPVLSLSEWLESHPAQFDLLKLDCEGAEWELVTECAESLARFSVVVAEIHRDPIANRTPADFVTLMTRAGFVDRSPSRKMFVGVREGT